MEQICSHVELLTRTLCDSLPSYGVDGAYLYCQTKTNEQSVFETGRFLRKNALASKILILQAQALSGFPGYSHWLKQLQDIGLSRDEIEGIQIGKTSIIHTLIESEALVDYLKCNNYTSVFVVAPPFQQLRAFMTAVTVTLREYPELLVFSYPGVSKPWQDTVIHSQGHLQSSRKDLIRSELERITTYQRKGDLASFNEVLEYLDGRSLLLPSAESTK